MKRLNLINLPLRPLPFGICLTVLAFPILASMHSCSKDTATDSVPQAPDGTAKYTITQTLSDEAQRNTIAFDALAFMTGCVGAQTFLPPGKVADYSGFQYLRDNDPTNLGHNTSFVTIIAFNVLNILDASQRQMYIDAANDQIGMINDYAAMRYPLCKAFRRLVDGDLPTGTTGLDPEAVKVYSAALYKLDGQISYHRAALFINVINSFTPAQKAQFDALKALNGIGNWNSSPEDPLKDLQLSKDVNVAVMTFASEMFAWYAGSVDADVYFCPERQGTYFGSFFLKDWPAMGNPNYTINEQLTASAGQDFLKILTDGQSSRITGIVDLQRSALESIVSTRQSVSAELRKFLAGGIADSSVVYALSESYGRYDGEIIWLFASRFSEVYQSLGTEQKAALEKLAGDLGYLDPPGAFLYSDPVPMPEIMNTDFLFK